MGRPAKPTNLKLLQGNPGKRKINKNEPAPDIEIPDPTMPLNGYALEEWNRIAPILEDLGLISEVDATALTMYCVHFQQLRETVEELQDLDSKLMTAQSGHAQQHPFFSIINKQSKMCHKYLQEFGMTPASRSKVTALKKKADEHPLAKFKK